MHWFSGGTQYFLVSSPPRRGQTFRKVAKVKFLALAMLPGLMAIAVTNKVFPPPFHRRYSPEIDAGERPLNFEFPNVGERRRFNMFAI